MQHVAITWDRTLVHVIQATLEMDQFVATLMNVEIVHVIQMQSAQIHLALTAAPAELVFLEMALLAQVSPHNFRFTAFFLMSSSGNKEC